MLKYILIQVFLTLLTTTTIVISQDNNNGNQVAQLVNNIQPKANITCLCTEDEQCDANSQTCQLTHPDHTCYESWTLEPSDGTIHVVAGYEISYLYITFVFIYSISCIDVCTMIISSYE